VSLKDIRREALNHRLNEEQTKALLDALVKARWLQESTEQPPRGRPKRRWHVNPALWEQKYS